MENYVLKDKIQADAEFLNSLAAKSWQEIENLKNIVSNLDNSSVKASNLKYLLNNLVTNYYVFIGGLENLTGDEEASNESNNIGLKTEISKDNLEITGKSVLAPKEGPVLETAVELRQPAAPLVEFEIDKGHTADNFEPFEYFVDFDEPLGEAISDEDLYGNT